MLISWVRYAIISTRSEQIHHLSHTQLQRTRIAAPSRQLRANASIPMPSSQVQFSVLSHAAWAPQITTPADWLRWASAPFVIDGADEPKVVAMPAILRRRAGFPGKMALEVAYQCLGDQQNVPTVFCARHGDVERSLGLLGSLTNNEPLSPTAFGLSVHNATPGLFSIARGDSANHIAISAGANTAEVGVIEACGLLADGAQQVLLVVFDAAPPALFTPYMDCHEQSYAWAWLLTSANADVAPVYQLSWSDATHEDSTGNGADGADMANMPGGLAVWKF